MASNSATSAPLEDFISLKPETNFETILKQKNIPFKKNVKFVMDGNNLAMIDYIFPYGALMIRENMKGKSIHSKLKILSQHLPSYFSLYVYTDNSHGKFGRIKYISSLREIELVIPDTYIFDNSIVRILGSRYNQNYNQMLEMYKGFYTYRSVYDHESVSLDDYELERLERFQVRFIETINKPIKVVTRWNSIRIQEDSIKNLNQYFEIFIDKFKFFDVPLGSPQRLVEGISSVCKKCQNLCWSNYTKDGCCIYCGDKKYIREQVKEINKKHKIADLVVALKVKICIGEKKKVDKKRKRLSPSIDS